MNETRYRESERRLWASKGVEPTEKVVRLQTLGMDLRVQEVGDGTPIVFVHGGNTAGTSWASLVAALEGFRRIVIDRPGCGLSPAPAAPLSADSLPGFGDGLVVDLLDGLGLDSAHLLGTSLGGYIVLRTAAAHPARVRRVVELGWPFAASRRLPAWMRMTSVPGLALLMNAMPVNERSVRIIFRGIGHGASLRDGRISAQEIDWFVSLLRDTDTMKNDSAPGRRLISPMRGIKERAVLSDATLSAITAPLQFIWGEDDPFGGAEAARAFVKRVPGAQLLLLPNAGHAPWLDELELCRRTISGFLGDG